MKTEVILKWEAILEAQGPNSLLNFYISEDNAGSKRTCKKPAPENTVQQWTKGSR